jgi:hypothetical protein
MGHQDVTELRTNPRTQKKLPVRFRLENAQVSTESMDFINAVTRNISEGGMFLEVPADVSLKDDPKGVFFLFKKRLSFEITLPGRTDPVRAKGKSVWVEEETSLDRPDSGYGVGIQFTEIDPDGSKLIQDFVDNILSEQ